MWIKERTTDGEVLVVEASRYDFACRHSRGVSFNHFSEEVPVYNCDCCMARLTVDEVKLIYGENQQPAGQDIEL